jgi:DNA-binding Lrp family transcriptional regulator
MKIVCPIKLDKKDKMIMGQLEANSRMSYSEIGRKVGLSGETTEYRINRMIRAGLIIRMFAEPNLELLGLKTYRIYLKVENMKKDEEEQMVQYFMKHPKSQWFAHFEGNWDYTIRYTLADEIEFRKEMDELLRRFGHRIKEKSIVVSLQQSFLPLAHFTGKQGKAHQISLERVCKHESLDEYDQQIMKLLFENSRIKTVDIASRLGLSPDAIQYRIRKLRKKGIIRFFGAYFNSQVLGFERYKVLFWFHHAKKGRQERLIRYCENHPNSTYLNRVVADWDLEVDFDSRDSAELHKMVRSIRDRFHDVIRYHSSLSIQREHLINPFSGSVS